jgi:hypothetical protein
MTLAEEAQRYLAVVAVFRAEGCEPHWRRETPFERAQLSSSALSPRVRARAAAGSGSRAS